MIEHKLADIVGRDGVRLDEPMNQHTTFRVGGPADYFVEPGSADEIAQVMSLCREESLPFYLLGRGSNVVVADAGLRGVVVHIGQKMEDIEVLADGAVTAKAGTPNAVLARAAQSAGLAGLEFAAGIPGTIGGAAIMNAGAYGSDLSDVATSITCLKPDGRVAELSAAEARWGYRSSRMMDDGSVVLAVQLALQPGDPDEIQARMAELARKRADKQPLDMPSAGSTFKRPEGHFAGKLIQDAGMQGHRVGGAQVSGKHAGFVVNAGSATASDVLQVIDDVAERVLAEFGVELVPEVRLWGFEGR